jgi:hypothetical protein
MFILFFVILHFLHTVLVKAWSSRHVEYLHSLAKGKPILRLLAKIRNEFKDTRSSEKVLNPSRGSVPIVASLPMLIPSVGPCQGMKLHALLVEEDWVECFGRGCVAVLSSVSAGRIDGNFLSPFSSCGRSSPL